MAGTETQYEEDGEPSAQEPSSSSSSIATGTLAYTHPLTDRRRASRAKQKFVTQMTPWSPGVPSIPFEVILDDISETGAGVLVERPCQLGMRYLLTVPREGGGAPIVREYNVMRCDLRPDGKYGIGLELALGMTAGIATSPPNQREPVTTPRLKLLFLAFGFVGLFVAAFYPL
jgi:hypothetical protein